ncbi:uncharacterized protein LY89DRAFT_789455 [Mollisia scopiformis]|uniref:SH3 domain-containing protein n=1 Tax=Mollisia scopiformis TaxID=149040 RepID=A0A132B5T0_MOLSC|nr:uncharacterized protein LY89DRAFT_789455 [Mollisia scopiformis]KUJ07768.1 hypothetical protein LY89DRAFT_789455 [Mollisia scopiformis]
MAELAAIASIVGVAAKGAQLSMVLFEFGSTIGSARSEVNQIATEISQFCGVLKQLHSTLTRAQARRYSISAIATTQDILKRCQEIFKEIEDIVHPLQKSTGKSNEQLSVDVIARVKWTFKRSKVQVLQKTLESSKNTLQLMLLVLDLARKTVSPRASTIDKQLEDQQEQVIIQGLIAAQRCAVDQLETLENEAEEQDSHQRDPIPKIKSPDALDEISATEDREQVMGDESEDERDVKKQRDSVWVNDLIFSNSPLSPGFRRNTWDDAVSSPSIESQAAHLFQVWTDQAPEEAETSGQNDEKSSGSGVATDISEEKSGNKWKPLPKPPAQPHILAQPPETLYVVVLYDYEDDDTPNLAIREGDIIQVITKLESGWWDGVLHGVRGWFPSNYTRPIGNGSIFSDLIEELDEAEYEDEDENEDNFGVDNVDGDELDDVFRSRFSG